MSAEKSYQLEDLLAVMQRLRDPEQGCPWDLKQTPQSLTRYTIEECYELIDAIEAADSEHILEELGDVLLQVVFYCQFARETGDFSFADVVHTLTAKLIRRHPHVFQTEQRLTSAQAVTERWDAIKQQEREAKQQSGLVADVPAALPALMRAHKLQKRAAQVGLDYSSMQLSLAALKSDIEQLEASLAGTTDTQVKDQLGELLFNCVAVARHAQCQAEMCLRAKNNTFKAHVASIDENLTQAQREWSELESHELDAYWQNITASE